MLLDIRNLTVRYKTDEGIVKAVNDLSLSVKQGETLGIVGETGAGKTTIALSIMGLVPYPAGQIVNGEIIFNGKNIEKLNNKQMQKIRGNNISMVFQDPMTSLNPVISVGNQIAEVIQTHENITIKDAEEKAKHLLEMVGILRDRYNDYPHQLSGGMKQRIVIAIALACKPQLLIADEPTTALDVTIQAQVLDKIEKLKKEFATSMIMISHDLAVIAETCSKVAVIYAGEIVEYGQINKIFENTAHPYTRGLFKSLPSIVGKKERLYPIPGFMPRAINLFIGCKFAPRCLHAIDECREKKQELKEISDEHFIRCEILAKNN